LVDRCWRSVAPALLGGFLLAGCRSSAPGTNAENRAAAPATTGGPSVWSVDFMTVRPGEHDRYRRFLEANWAKARRTARDRGLIRSYRALFTPDTATSGFHVILLTEYPDSAAYERREDIFQPIFTAQGRTLIDGKATRELTSKVENHWLVGLLGAP
jgi:hypothetical protein